MDRIFAGEKTDHLLNKRNSLADGLDRVTPCGWVAFQGSLGEMTVRAPLARFILATLNAEIARRIPLRGGLLVPGLSASSYHGVCRGH